eukprot:jgi/Tetstr1/442426/TSEL_030550.t1
MTHLGEPPEGVVLTGVVIGAAGAWTVVRFSRAHPEITGDHNLKATILTRIDVPDFPGTFMGQDQSVMDANAENRRLTQRADADIIEDIAGDSAEPNDDALAPHADRMKIKYKDGKVTITMYTVDQRASHATYRLHFNAIHINKMPIGPNSVAKGWAARNTLRVVVP